MADPKIEKYRQEYIDTIEALYPLDSGWRDTEAVAWKIFTNVMKDYNWRDLPTDLLKEYAAACEFQERTNIIKP